MDRRWLKSFLFHQLSELRMKSEAQRFLTMLTSEMLSMLSTCTSMPTGMAAPETTTQERFKLINHRNIQSEMFSFYLRWGLWRSHTHTYLELHLHFWHFASCISGSRNFKWLLNNVNCHIKLQITSNTQDSVSLFQRLIPHSLGNYLNIWNKTYLKVNIKYHLTCADL